MRDLKQELSTWAGWPPAWRPEPGEVLVARIEQYAEGRSRFGPVRTAVVTVEDTGERVSLWLSSTVLLNEFARLRPQPGERIGLKYLGRDEGKGYHRYRLVVDRAEPLDFTPLGGEVLEGDPFAD